MFVGKRGCSLIVDSVKARLLLYDTREVIKTNEDWWEEERKEKKKSMYFFEGGKGLDKSFLNKNFFFVEPKIIIKNKLLLYYKRYFKYECENVES